MSKLFRVLKYINGTRELTLILEPNNSNNIEIYVDASYGIHNDGKSHTGMCIKHGNGTIECKSTKQRINTKSSTESELIALSDMSTTAIWINEFIKHQQYKLSTTIIYQDNKSTITMINNGNSNKERTRHINLRYFWLRDRIKSGEVIITYKQTSEMIADILTKTIQGKQFTYLRDKLLNTPYNDRFC
jgi:histone deacetylase 1/2